MSPMFGPSGVSIVVARVDVTDVEAGALTRQTTGAQRVESTLMAQARERVVLVHELRELAGAEELLDRSHDRPDVDQRLRRDRLDVLGGHPLTHDALHAGQSDADLILDQLADRTDATVAEVVDVVDLNRHLERIGAGHLGQRRHMRISIVQPDEVLDDRDDVLGRQRGRTVHRVVGQPQLLVDLVTADTSKVVALLLEEQVLQQRLGGFLGRRLTRAQLAVDLQQRFVRVGRGVLLQRRHHDLGEAETLLDLLGGQTERLE